MNWLTVSRGGSPEDVVIQLRERIDAWGHEAQCKIVGAKAYESKRLAGRIEALTQVQALLNGIKFV